MILFKVAKQEADHGGKTERSAKWEAQRAMTGLPTAGVDVQHPNRGNNAELELADPLEHLRPTNGILYGATILTGSWFRRRTVSLPSWHLV